jgi:hypothetical protein
MRSGLTPVIEEYLKSVGALAPVTLGDRKKDSVDLPAAATAKDNELFARALERRAASGRYIIVITVVLLCLLSGVVLVSALRYRDDPKVLGALVAGAFLSQLGIVARLRQLWLDKTVIDISIPVLEELPANEAADFICLLYWNLVRKGSKGVARKSGVLGGG